MSFQIGDEVICINTDDSQFLVKGRKYTVGPTNRKSPRIGIVEAKAEYPNHGYFPKQFRLVTPLNLENE